MPNADWSINSNPAMLELAFYPEGKDRYNWAYPWEKITLTPDDDRPGRWILSAKDNAWLPDIKKHPLVQKYHLAPRGPGVWSTSLEDALEILGSFKIPGDGLPAEMRQKAEKVMAQRVKDLTPAAVPAAAPPTPPKRLYPRYDALRNPYDWVETEGESPPRAAAQTESWPGPGIYYSPSAQTGNKDGADPYSPLLSDSEAAEAKAIYGETLPFAVNTGKPRVVELEIKDGSAEARIPVFYPSQDWHVNREGLGFQLYSTQIEAHWGDTREEHFQYKMEAKNEAEEELEEIYQDLLREGREAAEYIGAPAFYLDLDRYGEGTPLYLTNPKEGKVLGVEEVGGPLPGVPAAPEIKDLVLYHGGQRRPGILSLDYRRTAEGEAFDPLPILADTPAIWTGEDINTARSYAGSGNTRDSHADERQIYFLDAPGAKVATVNTEKLGRAQGQAVIEKLMEDKVNIFHLKRGSDIEYFITDQFKPEIVKVNSVDQDKVGYGEIPPVMLQGESALNLAAPSESFCRIMQAYAAEQIRRTKAEPSQFYQVGEHESRVAAAEDRLKLWTEKCEETRPILGPTGLEQVIAANEALLQKLTPDSSEYILAQARLDYWLAYKDGLKHTDDGYVYQAEKEKRPGEDEAQTPLERAEEEIGEIAARSAAKPGGDLRLGI